MPYIFVVHSKRLVPLVHGVPLWFLKNKKINNKNVGAGYILPLWGLINSSITGITYY